MNITLINMAIFLDPPGQKPGAADHKHMIYNDAALLGNVTKRPEMALFRHDLRHDFRPDLSHRTSPFSQWRDDSDRPTVVRYNYYIAARGECP